MTHEEYLNRQEELTLRALSRAQGRIVRQVSKVVGLRDLVREQPVLTLGAGVAAGFLTGTMLRSKSQRLARSAFRSVLVPLVRPTIRGLGTAIASVLVGGPHRPGSAD